MFGIGYLLKRTQNRRAQALFVRDIARLAIKELTGADISVDHIHLNGATIMIVSISATLKSEIYIKKGSLISFTNSKQNIIKIKDIR